MTTILVTGATDGLGRALADRLAGPGTTLLLHGRDPAKLASLTGGRTFRADFASLAEVRALAEEVRSATDRLDVLVNNAGTHGAEERAVSADGYELTFAVNYLAPFLLTQELLPLLRASSPARIVHVASVGQAAPDFADLMLERSYGGRRAYNQSKLAQIISGLELAGRLPAAEVTVNSLHPGTLMPTKLALAGYGRTIDPLETGIEATARLVLDPSLAGVTGRYFDRQREVRPDAAAYDPAVRAELWKRSLDLTGAPDF